jgi:hypothetical protein
MNNIPYMPSKPRCVFLQRQPSGSFVDWGRHASVNSVRGEGPALWYTGEAAEVLALVLKYTAPPPPETSASRYCAGGEGSAPPSSSFSSP